MNAINPALADQSGHDSWLPVLQLAAQEVFELMLSSHLEQPAVPPDESGLDITSMVGMAGQLCGVLSIRCRTSSAAQMASKMLGVDVEKAGPKMWDAIGEISNMVAGNFKNKISGLGDGCMLSVPTVITGSDYSLHPLSDENGVRCTLLFEGQAIVLSLEIHS